MKINDPEEFHHLNGARKARAVYYKKDCADYVVMITITGLLVFLTYGAGSVMTVAGLGLSVFMVVVFTIRHGSEMAVPLFLRAPLAVPNMLFYKLRNLKPPYFVAVGLLILENLLIAATPSLPHHTSFMRQAALVLFYTHFAGITAFRTVILVDHLAKRRLVHEVLMETPWRRSIKKGTNITLEIIHAYATGILTHVVLLAPWYLVITHVQFSILFLAPACVAELLIHVQWLKRINEWFYRDHWLGHNAEFEFLFLHGPHHDAIPSGLIAVAENGFLEGFLRFTLGAPTTYYNPLVAFLVFTAEIEKDIEAHQYIPGVFPKLSKQLMESSQHSTHHYGPIEPYGFAIKMDQVAASETYKKSVMRFLAPEELITSAKLDEELDGFKWDNPTYRHTLKLFAKYQGKP